MIQNQCFFDSTRYKSFGILKKAVKLLIFAFGTNSVLGGRWFSKTLRNLKGWSSKILIFPYRGRYVVKKGQKHPYMINQWPLTQTRLETDGETW